MLPDDQLQLLTAFVDGELSQRQHKAVMRLLHKSSEARTVLKQLQENAHQLKKARRHKLEPSLVDEILQAIAEQQAVPAAPPSRSRASRRRWLPYVAASLAASLLIGAIGLIYWKSMIDPNPDKKTDIVKNDPGKKIEPKIVPPPDPDPIPSPEKLQPEMKPNPLPYDIAIDVARGFIAPVQPGTIFTARFQDLAKPAIAERFSTEVIRKKKLIQLEVTVKNNALAMERLKAALAERGLLVLSDPSAVKALKSAAKREYWVYAENLDEDELSKLVQALAKADTTGKGKSVPSPYDKLKLTAITNQETKTMAGLLGVSGDPLAVPKGAKAPATPPERWQRKAILLPTASPKKQSAEIRQFLSERQRPTPGAVQVLIKIHQP